MSWSNAWQNGFNGGSQWGNNYSALDHHLHGMGASAKAAEEAAKKKAAEDAAAQTKKGW
jgi:hypothetical protein